jgi:hypothetical protein
MENNVARPEFVVPGGVSSASSFLIICKTLSLGFQPQRLGKTVIFSHYSHGRTISQMRGLDFQPLGLEETVVFFRGSCP